MSVKFSWLECNDNSFKLHLFGYNICESMVGSLMIILCFPEQFEALCQW